MRSFLLLTILESCACISSLPITQTPNVRTYSHPRSFRKQQPVERINRGLRRLLTFLVGQRYGAVVQGGVAQGVHVGSRVDVHADIIFFLPSGVYPQASARLGRGW